MHWSSQHSVTLLQVDKCIMPFISHLELYTNPHSFDKPLSIEAWQEQWQWRAWKFMVLIFIVVQWWTSIYFFFQWHTCYCSTSTVPQIKMFWILVSTSDGCISRSYSVLQLQTIPSVPSQFSAHCLPKHTSVDENFSCISHHLVVCNCLPGPGLAQLQINTLFCFQTHGCLGSCFGLASAAIRKCVKIC